MVGRLPVVAMLVLGACTRPGGPYPSLAPRAAEAIDPRVPIEAALNDRPVDGALATRLAALVSEARAGDAAFAPAMDQAERLASGAGTRESESWIAAQQALSGAIAARAPTARALGEIDALGANKLQAQGGLAPNDLKAIEEAGAAAGAIDQRQQARIAAVRARLGN